MFYYTVAEIEVTHQDWVTDYVRQVTQLVEQHGGRYLARTNNYERWEGDQRPPQLFLLIEWPSKEHAATFYTSEAYQPFLQSRLAGSRGSLYLVPGEDVTRVARVRT